MIQNTAHLIGPDTVEVQDKTWRQSSMNMADTHPQVSNTGDGSVNWILLKKNTKRLQEYKFKSEKKHVARKMAQ